jgi:hypothetical protein
MEPDDDGSEPDGRPDLTEGDPVEHLWSAAHEMLRAFRTLIDAADGFVESQRGGRPDGRGGSEPREARVHRIDIDDPNTGDRHTDDRHTDDPRDTETGVA